jgi:hypothetical protein
LVAPADLSAVVDFVLSIVCYVKPVDLKWLTENVSKRMVKFAQYHLLIMQNWKKVS